MEMVERERCHAVRNEIGFMEDSVEEILGKQLHLEIENEGVHDYDTFQLFQVDSVNYVLCLRISEGREGYLLKMEELGDGWWTVKDIVDDAEWERARDASNWQEHTIIVHR
jgi:hypothetical protein